MKWLTESAARLFVAGLRPVVVPALVSLLVALGLDPQCAAVVADSIGKPFGL